MTPAGCSGTPGRLLDEDPVQSAMDAYSYHRLRHFLPNSARIGYATEGAFFISAQMSIDTLSAL